MFDTITDSLAGAGNYAPMVIFVNLILAFVLGIFISLAYKMNHKGLSYSQSLVFSFVLLSVTASSVIMVIGNNLARAFGLVGALSIIRFRTVVKDTKDTAYVFFALAIGLGTGTSLYTLALISTAVFIAVDTLLTRSNFASIRKHDYIVRFSFNSEGQTDDVYKDIFEKFTTNIHLVDINVISRDNVEYSYNVQMRKETKLNDFINELGKVQGISNMNIVTSKMDVEY